MRVDWPRRRGIRRCSVALGCLIASAGAGAWSSKDFPLFDPVHQMAIQNVLKNLVSAQDLTALMDQQAVVDQDQNANQSFEHAMTGIENANQKPAVQRQLYIQKTEDFISRNLADAIAKRKAGARPAAMIALGTALHPLQDATSPVHEDFQPWRFDESWIAATQHISQERFYPDDSMSPGYRARLEGVVRWAYDIYIEKAPMPHQFFDASGALQIPPDYLGP